MKIKSVISILRNNFYAKRFAVLRISHIKIDKNLSHINAAFTEIDK